MPTLPRDLLVTFLHGGMSHLGTYGAQKLTTAFEEWRAKRAQAKAPPAPPSQPRLRSRP